MSVTLTSCLQDNTSFREDAPRPPVPGEEGVECHISPSHHRTKGPKAVTCNPRRDDDLGEPEGSASPDSPLTRWTKSLHFLLGDQDGAHLFRMFLDREKCVDTLDFWFACNGFRQMDLGDPKTVRVAKAIHKRYVENNCVVSRQLKPATKTYIRDSIKRLHIDSAMFNQAQTEIQSQMEENSYQMFLSSDIYLEYVRTGGESSPFAGSAELGGMRLVCGYLPTLNEEEEWHCSELKNKKLPAGCGLPAARCTEGSGGKGYRCYGRNGPASPYHVNVNSGLSLAPTGSANDSEVSSDAMTDDTMSMTDSSVDGIPPYRLKKQQQRDIHRSVRANGQVALPHFPRTHRLPKEMTPVEPAAFAGELIARLRKLKEERDSLESLEERLQQLKAEELEVPALAVVPVKVPSEGEMPPSHPPHSLPLLGAGSHEEDPQAILDDHLSRVLKTPGCQSPGVAKHSPRSRSPDPPRTLKPQPGPPARGFTGKPVGKSVHHHYVHHHAGPKSKEQIEAEAAQRVQCLCPASADYCSFLKCQPHPKTMDNSHQQGEPFGSGSLARRCTRSVELSEAPPSPQPPGEESDRAHNVWQWVLESERPSGKHRAHSAQVTKRSSVPDVGRAVCGGRQHGNGAHQRAVVLPCHPFIQDPAMPPLPPPNTLAQLEEARRRLEEDRKSSKVQRQRHSSATLQRDRSHGVLVPGGNPSPANTALTPFTDECKAPKKQLLTHLPLPSELIVTYFFCGEDIPYRRMMKGNSLTLGHFKEQLRRKGNYRYYFKRASDEFDCGAVFEEIWSDEAKLPMYHGKILGKVERFD
ncbi:axin-2 isoform X2 [Callorhinchus milii]|uniref:axin-2 isoform X2 n=1 Tax=Callorhinchus milii TaxID=7868 RepID=UPI001C3F4E41|nr:axin-2 isoform X2 [Callorhinchus milii]